MIRHRTSLTPKSPRLSLALLGLCGVALAGCATEGADVILAQPESVQRQAFADCAAADPSVGAIALQRLDLSGGRVSIFAANGNGVSLAQARSLNQCARARMLSGQVSATATHAPHQPSGYVQPNATRASVTVPGCIPGLGVMQRGTLYCVGH